jgi:hypothetical protein
MADMRSKGWKTKDGREIIAKPLDYVSKNRDTSWRFKSLGKDERKRIGQGEKDISNYRKKRQDWETIKPDRPGERSHRGFEPTTIKTPRSPIKSKSRERFKERKSLSNRYKEPKPDPNVEPLKRRYDYDRRGSREKDSDRGWNSDDRRKKTDDRGIQTDDRSLKTENRGQRTDDRGIETRRNTGRRTGDGGRNRHQN